MLELFKIAGTAAVIGYVYSIILIQPDHILGPFYAWLKKLLTWSKTVKEIRELPEEIARMKGEKYETITRVETKESKLLKPLGGCELCTAGQLSLWLFLYQKRTLLYSFNYNSIFDALIHLIFTICLTILLTRILYLAIQKLSRS